MQPILAEAGEIDGVGEHVLIVTDHKSSQTHELVGFRQLVRIEQDFLRRLHAALAAALDRILLALDGARIIQVIAAAKGHGEVGLFHVAEHLFVERILERRQVAGHGRRVGVLGFQISDHLGIRLLAQPVVIVHHGSVVAHFAMIDRGSDGRRGIGGADNQRGEKEQRKRQLDDVVDLGGIHAADYIAEVAACSARRVGIV